MFNRLTIVSLAFIDIIMLQQILENKMLCTTMPRFSYIL